MNAKTLDDLSGPEIDALARDCTPVRSALAAANAAASRVSALVVALEAAQEAYSKAHQRAREAVAQALALEADLAAGKTRHPRATFAKRVRKTDR